MCCRLLRYDLTASIAIASLSFRDAGGVHSLRKAAGTFAAGGAGGGATNVLLYRNVRIEDVLLTPKGGGCFQVCVSALHHHAFLDICPCCPSQGECILAATALDGHQMLVLWLYH